MGAGGDGAAGSGGGVPTKGDRGDVIPGSTDQGVSLMSGSSGRNEKGNSLGSVDQEDRERTLLEALA